MFDVCLLGTGGMLPIPRRFLSSMMLRYNGTTILVDCGEGTQIPMQQLGWGFKNIDTIIFTHYHGDHITGLPGIIYQMLNTDRTEPLRLMGPKGIIILKNLIDALFDRISFKIEFIELEHDVPIDIGDITVNNTEAYHTIPCYSYSFSIKRLPKFDVEKANSNGIPVKFWNILQHGGTVSYKDKLLIPDMVLSEPRKGLKVSFSTDTRPLDNIRNLIELSNLYIGEGMYGDENEKDKAVEKRHSTFMETAKMAKDANVSELWLTHFSPSMKNPDIFINNAKCMFENVRIGKDLMGKSLKFI